MTNKSILNIRPDKIDIAGKPWDDDDAQLLAAREQQLFASVLEYWKPLLAKRREYVDRYEGKIINPAQRAIYEGVENKIVIEPPIAKPLVRALVGQSIKSRKSGQVVTERGALAQDNADELETINAVMKYMETKTGESHRITEAIAQSFISCYWNVILFDKDNPANNPDGMRFKLRNLPWDSCLFGPTSIRQPDGSDIKEIYYFDYRTVAELIDNFPDMENEILRHFDANDHIDNRMLSSLDHWNGWTSADEREAMYSIANYAHSARGAAGGKIKVMWHLFPIRRKEDVWVNTMDGGETVEIKPPDWDNERWMRWQMENPHFVGPYEREVIILWSTVFTESGMVLSNAEHWYQENGQLPCSFWLSDVSNNQPTGVMADISDDVLANCVAEIEALDDIRKGSGRLFAVRAGAVQPDSLKNLTAEANLAVGSVVIEKNFNGNIADALQEMVRQPNRAWEAWADRRKNSMYETCRVNEAMMGEHSPRQSAIAKEAEISQAMIVNARYVDNINRCWDMHQNLKLRMIPYFFDQAETIEIEDEESGGVHAYEVNQPAGFDMEGNVTSVVNDLQSHRYRWRVNPVDDSPVAKVRSMDEAMVFLNGVAGPIMQADPTGTLLVEMMAATSNPMLMKAAKKMAETAAQSAQAAQQAEQHKNMIDDAVKLGKLKADLERAAKHGVIVTGQFTDMADYPQLAELFAAIQHRADAAADQGLAEVMQIAGGGNNENQNIENLMGTGTPRNAPP